jgi:hypothetical protein
LGIRPANWKGIGEMSGSHWGQIQASAKIRGLDVRVTHQDVWDLFLAQERKCALTGTPIQFAAIGDDTGETCTASLDRIDSNQGYIPGNIQWVDKRLQRMKWDLPQQEFVDLCRAVAAHHGP